MKLHFRYSLILYLFGLGLFCSAHAAETEFEVLTRLMNEIKALVPLVNEAQSVADPDRREQFAYSQLKQDLTTIRHGIEEYLLIPRSPPRRIDPLLGSYRR